MIVRLLASSSSGIFRGNGYLKKIYEPLKAVDCPWVVGQNIYSRWSWLIKSFSFASPAKRQENVQGAFKTLPKRFDSEKVESSWKSSASSSWVKKKKRWANELVRGLSLKVNAWSAIYDLSSSHHLSISILVANHYHLTVFCPWVRGGSFKTVQKVEEINARLKGII